MADEHTRDGDRSRVASRVRRVARRVGIRSGASARGVAAEGRSAADRIDDLLARLSRQLGPASAEALMLQALHGARIRPGFWSPSAFLRNLQRLASAFSDARAPSDAHEPSVAHHGTPLAP